MCLNTIMSGLNKVRGLSLSDHRWGGQRASCAELKARSLRLCVQRMRNEKRAHERVKNVKSLDQNSSHQPQYEITTGMKETNSWSSFYQECFGDTPSCRVRIAEGELLPSPRGVENRLGRDVFEETRRKICGNFYKSLSLAGKNKSSSYLTRLCLVFVICVLFVKHLRKPRDGRIRLSSHCCCCCGRQTRGAFCTTTIIAWCVSLQCESLEKLTSTLPKNLHFHIMIF